MRQRTTCVSFSEKTCSPTCREDSPCRWVTTISGQYKNAETGGLDAAAQIHFLAVEKERGIEEAGLLERLAAKNHEGAGYPVHFRRLKRDRPRCVRRLQRRGSGESARRGR